MRFLSDTAGWHFTKATRIANARCVEVMLVDWSMLILRSWISPGTVHSGEEQLFYRFAVLGGLLVPAYNYGMRICQIWLLMRRVLSKPTSPETPLDSIPNSMPCKTSMLFLAEVYGEPIQYIPRT